MNPEERQRIEAIRECLLIGETPPRGDTAWLLELVERQEVRERELIDVVREFADEADGGWEDWSEIDWQSAPWHWRPLRGLIRDAEAVEP